MKLRGKKKDDEKSKKSEKKVRPVASVHILKKGGLAAAQRGEEIRSLCGTKIEGNAPPTDAPICQACVLVQFNEDDSATTKAKRDEFTRGKADQQAEVRRSIMTEIRQEADRRAAAERAEAEAEAARTKYEISGDTIRMKLDDGGEATLRTSQIGSVRLVQDAENNKWHVVIDGEVAYTHNDEGKVREHHDSIHETVFGPRALAS